MNLAPWMELSLQLASRKGSIPTDCTELPPENDENCQCYYADNLQTVHPCSAIFRQYLAIVCVHWGHDIGTVLGRGATKQPLPWGTKPGGYSTNCLRREGWKGWQRAYSMVHHHRGCCSGLTCCSAAQQSAPSHSGRTSSHAGKRKVVLALWWSDLFCTHLNLSQEGQWLTQLKAQFVCVLAVGLVRQSLQALLLKVTKICHCLHL